MRFRIVVLKQIEKCSFRDLYTLPWNCSHLWLLSLVTVKNCPVSAGLQIMGMVGGDCAYIARGINASARIAPAQGSRAPWSSWKRFCSWMCNWRVKSAQFSAFCKLFIKRKTSPSHRICVGPIGATRSLGRLGCILECLHSGEFQQHAGEVAILRETVASRVKFTINVQSAV